MPSPDDVIDHLAGIAPGSALDGIRRRRQVARDNAQASYQALFAPAETADMSVAERFALAVFVCGLHRQTDVAAFYAEGLRTAGGEALVPALAAEAARGATEGPSGHYPAGLLSVENTPGPSYAADAGPLGARLAAALGHAHMLVFHPRDASAAALQALLDAGWSTTGIVTLSQEVAFLAFQLRVVHGLRALAAHPA